MHASDKDHLKAERTERVGRIERATRESSIVCSVNLDGTGKADISTGLPFFDHMLTAFGSHGSFDLKPTYASSARSSEACLQLL